MKYVAIDTSGKNLTVVVNNGKNTFCHYEEECGVRHSVRLNQVIEELVDKSGLNLAEADFFACVVGAGSFTGIRIGVSTIKALCLSFNKPALSITSFDTIAYNKRGNNLVLIDAGHGGYYACGYDKDMNVTYSARYALKEEIAPLKSKYDFICGAKVEGLKAKKLPIDKGLIEAVNVKANQTVSPNELTPLYLRKSQAEEGRL